MPVGRHVADDPRRRLEPVELLAGLHVDRLEIPFERVAEDKPIRRRQGARPNREGLLVRPFDLADTGIPRDEEAGRPCDSAAHAIMRAKRGRVALLQFRASIAVDFRAERDFHEFGGLPKHSALLLYCLASSSELVEPRPIVLWY